MMITKYWSCNRCGSIIKTRIGVGMEKEFEFTFDCPKCNQEINGLFLIEDNGVEPKDIWKMDGVTLSKEEKFEFSFTYHPDFPSQVTNDISFPFIDATARVGDNFEWMALRQTWWHTISYKKIEDLKMIYKNYRSKNNTYFEKGINEFSQGVSPQERKIILESLLPSNIPLKTEKDKLNALYRALDVVLYPIVFSNNFIRWYELINAHLYDLYKYDPQLFDKYVEYVYSNHFLNTLQEKSFDYFIRFLNMRKDFSAVIFDWNPENPEALFTQTSTITGNMRFDDVKSLYVDGFELISDGLLIIFGFINLKYRKDFNSFAKHPTINSNKPYAKDLKHFDRQNNSPKFDLLEEDPNFSQWINPLIDPALRNAIGHNDIQFNKKTGIITYKEKDVIHTISYGEFLFKCLKQVLLIHRINLIVKLLNDWVL